jgi:hypothetical protein
MKFLGMDCLYENLLRLEPLDPSYVPKTSMLREFIGTIGLN